MSFSKQLAAVSVTLGCRFLLKGQPIEPEIVFSPTGLLPGLLRRADQLCSFCLGYGLGLTFERSESALNNVVVLLDDKVPNSLRLLCSLDVLIEFMQNAPAPDRVALDDLMME